MFKDGYSMEDDQSEYNIPNNSIVLINPKVKADDLDNKVVVVSVHGKIKCKQFQKKADHILFYSINRDYDKEDEKVYSNDEFSIIGEVVNVIKKLILNS